MTKKSLLGRLALAGCMMLAATQIGRSQVTLTDTGTGNPTPGLADQYSFSTANNGSGTVYPYTDHTGESGAGNPDGQVFTTGNSSGGYALNSVSLKLGGSYGNHGAQNGTGPSVFQLGLYQMSGNTATLITNYYTQSTALFTNSHWINITFPAVQLLPNTQYAFAFAATNKANQGYCQIADGSGGNSAGNINGYIASIPVPGGSTYSEGNPGGSGNTQYFFNLVFDVGMSALATALPTASANPVTAGTSVTLTAGSVTGNSGAITYQWQTDGGIGAFTNIPSANSSTYTANTTLLPVGGYQYRVAVTDSVPNVTISSPLILGVTAGPVIGTFSDIGTTAPTPGIGDQSQVNQVGNYVAGSLNYYTDNGYKNNAYAGQVFTTGANSAGYLVNSVAFQLGVTGSNSGNTTSQGYDLFIYQLSSDGYRATQIADITNAASFSVPRWIKWTFPAMALQPNTKYAYGFSRKGQTGGYNALATSLGTSDVYTGGQICTIPSTGGNVTYSTTAFEDGVFDVGIVPVGVFAINAPISSQNPVTAGTNFTLTCGAILDNAGNGSYTYQWQTDGGLSGNALTNIPGATSSTLAQTNYVPGVYGYDVVVTDSTSLSTNSLVLEQVVTEVLSGNLTDIGSASPQPQSYDLFQETDDGTTQASSLHYFSDNWPNTTAGMAGQTFTTANDGHNYVLNAVAIKIGAGGDSNPGTPFPYNLYIYELSTNGAIAYMIANVTNLNFSYTYGDYVQWTFPGVVLNPNTKYAYSFGKLAGGGWGGLSTSPADQDYYTGGSLALIPPTGGTVSYGAANQDGVFDIGLLQVNGLVVLPLVSSTSPASPATAGTSFTLSSGGIYGSSGTVTYQWQTDGGSGTLTNIPGPLGTSPTLTVNTTLTNLGNFQYELTVNDANNNPLTTPVLTVDVRQLVTGAFTDITNAPTPSSYDAAQLTAILGYYVAGQLNYYNDSSVAQGGWVGETFTTGSNPKGYSMGSIAIDTCANYPYNSGTTTPQPYSLNIYQISGSVATLIASISTNNAVFYGATNAGGTQQTGGAATPDWIQWTFPPLILSSNTVYAYTWHKSDNNTAASGASLNTDSGSTDLYPGGQEVAIQEAGGTVTYSSATTADGTFDVSLVPLGVSIIVNLPTASKNPVYALTPVKLTDTVNTPASGTFTYQWLTDDGSGAVPPNYIVIPGATGTNLTVVPQNLNPSGPDYTTNYYFVAYVGASAATSAPVTLIVHAATAPFFTSFPAITNYVEYAGDSVSFTVTENGTLPITNQWVFDDANNDGFGSLSLQTNTTLTLNNLLPNETGTYQIWATNVIGYNTSQSIGLTVLPVPAAPVAASQQYYNMVYTNHAWAYWRLQETNDPNSNDYGGATPPSVDAFDYSGHGFAANYGNQMTVNNPGPGSATYPTFPGFDTSEVAVGTENTADKGYLAVPSLNMTGNSNVTFIAWINPNAAPGASSGLLFNRGSGSAAYGFGFANNGADLGYTWNDNDPNTYNWDSLLAVKVSEWNFVAYVITPTNATVYLGNLDGGATNFTSAVHVYNHIGEPWNNGVIRLGNDANNNITRSFPGLITEAALFTNALSTAQIQAYFTTGIGAAGLATSVAATSVNPTNTVYSGQNVILTANYNGTAPSLRWESGPDGITWTDIPGATNGTLLVNPLTVGTIYYQLTVSNVLGSVTNVPVAVNYLPLPVTPPGLWTANFQTTNNLTASQYSGGGLGYYAGRGILGVGQYWNVLPQILLTNANSPYYGYNSATITSVSDFLDDGVTHSGVSCTFNNGGGYNGPGGSTVTPADINNLTGQFFRTYAAAGSNDVLQISGLPSGTYNLTCYAGDGLYRNGGANYGSTFTVHDALNGDQTNSTYEPALATSALSNGVNFVTFTGVHVSGGTLNVDVNVNPAAAGGTACIEAAQIQLVTYDPLVASFTGSPTNAFVKQLVTFVNTSTGSVTNSVWNFGDGTYVTNTSNANVTHAYAVAGTYSVSLTVIGPGGGPSSVTHLSYITTLPATTISSAKVTNGQFILKGGNGPVGSPYRILTSTNVALPLASWTPVWTNVFAADGSYGYTNASVTNAGSFYIMVAP
jgi:hypothetical protein